MMTHDMRQVWNVDRTKADKATVIGRIRDLCPEVEFQAVFYKRKEIWWRQTNQRWDSCN